LSKVLGVILCFFTTSLAVVSAPSVAIAYDSPVIDHENIGGPDMAGSGIKIIFGIVGVTFDRNFYRGGLYKPIFVIGYSG